MRHCYTKLFGFCLMKQGSVILVYYKKILVNIIYDKQFFICSVLLNV